MANLAEHLALSEEANDWPAGHPAAASVNALDALANHVNWEVSWGEHPQIEGEACWQVRARNGGRSDYEWTLIGTGSTPEAAIHAAIAKATA